MPADMPDNQNPKIPQDKSAVGTTPPTPNLVKSNDTFTNAPPKSGNVPIAPVADDANLETAQTLAKEKAEPVKPGEKPKVDTAPMVTSKPTPASIPSTALNVTSDGNKPKSTSLNPPTIPASKAQGQTEKPLGLTTPTAIPLKDEKMAMGTSPGSIPPKPPTGSTSTKPNPPQTDKTKTPGKGKKLIMAFLGFLLLLGGVVAGYYYYNAQTPQIAAVKDLSKEDCETYGCWDDRYSLYWNNDEQACKKQVDDSCSTGGGGGRGLSPGDCGYQDDSEACFVDTSEPQNCRNLGKENKTGICYRNNEICCNAGSSGGGGGDGSEDGTITGGTGRCNSNGCTGNVSNPECFVLRYHCDSNGLGGGRGCQDNQTGGPTYGTLTFNSTCGTEQIDVYCEGEVGLGDFVTKVYNSSCGTTTETHSVCNFNNQCVERDGAGSDQCSRNSDCVTETHSVCNENDQCVEVDGAGSDQCGDDSECVESETLACLSISQDSVTPQLGDAVDFVCAGSHSGGGDLTYQFRYRIDDGEFAPSVAIANATTISVSQVGVWEVQCRVCGSVNGSALCSSTWIGTTP